MNHIRRSKTRQELCTDWCGNSANGTQFSLTPNFSWVKQNLRNRLTVLTVSRLPRILIRTTGVAALCLAGLFNSSAASTNSAPEKYSPPPTIRLEPEQTDFLNRLGLNYRMGLNISVDFRKLGGLALS